MRHVGETIAFEWLDNERTMVAVTGTRPLTTSEWQRYIATLQEHEEEEMRILVVAGRARPDRAQQQQLTSLKHHERRRVVLLSDSVPLRFFVAVVSLVAPHLRLFSQERLGEALSFLELAPQEAHTVQKSLQRLRAEFEGPQSRDRFQVS